MAERKKNLGLERLEGEKRGLDLEEAKMEEELEESSKQWLLIFAFYFWSVGFCTERLQEE